MKVARRNSFRDYKALVLIKPCRDRVLLIKQLNRLGMDVQSYWPISYTSVPKTDVVFFDADAGRNAKCVTDTIEAIDGPSIALLASDTPSLVHWVLEQGATTCLMKPVRSVGVLANLIIAFDTFENRKRAALERVELEQRLKARPVVCLAIIRLMRAFDVEDGVAFSMIRDASMDRRLPIEAVSAMLVSGELNISAVCASGSVKQYTCGRPMR